ncbi:MAG: energy transducer TonB [bacterium]
MRKAFYLSLSGHVVIIALLLIMSWAFSRPAKRSYPRTISATFVAKSQPKANKPARRKVAPPKPRDSIKPVSKSKANRQAVKKTQRRNQPQPVVSNAKSRENASAVNTPSLKIDAPEFPFPEYLALIQYRIETQWRPPTNAGGGLLTTVYFRIGKNGRLSDFKVTKTSGNFVVDQAALRAVYGADPLPALPPESGLSSLGVHFDFVVY